MNISPGTIVLVDSDPGRGRERDRLVPCIAISDSEVNADQGFPLIAVVPLSGSTGEGALYPQVSPGKSGLLRSVYALVDRLRSVDKRRIRRVLGRVSSDDLTLVYDGIDLFLGMSRDA